MNFEFVCTLTLSLLVLSSSQEIRRRRPLVRRDQLSDQAEYQNQRQDNTFDFDQQKVSPPVRGKGRPDDESEDNIQGAGQRQNQGQAAGDEDHKPGTPYDFKYAINDGEGNEFSQKAESDGEQVKGEYRVLLPDGRLQIVRYTADWKNGYQATVTYEGTPRPYVHTTRKPRPGLPDENEENIQPGSFTPKPVTCPPGTSKTFGSSKCTPVTQKPIQVPQTQRPTCPPGTVRRFGDSRCRPIDENEEDIQPGGYTTTTKKPTTTTKAPCPPGTKRTFRDSKCRPIDEDEEDIKPGGYTTTSTTTRRPVTCPPGTVKAYGGTNGGGGPNCVPTTTYPPTRRTTTTTRRPVTCPPGSVKGSRDSWCRPIDEDEEDIKPGGYTTTSTTTRRPVTCPPGMVKSYGGPKGGPDCIPTTTNPPTRRTTTTTTQRPVTCPPGTVKAYGETAGGPKCLPAIDENEENILPGGYTTKKPKPPSNLYGAPDTPYHVRLNAKFGY